MCIDVAREAMQMHEAGADARAIRTQVEAKYRGAYQSMTPTPPVREK